MDIEPPHHPIESKRDFFIHLFTITCGLLIALSLESFVEWGHHRALVREARENIRREIEDNKKVTVEDIKSVKEDEAQFEKNLEQERGLRDDPKGAHHSINSSFSWSTMSDAAWRTARDTGALAYMPYAEVQRYSDLYGQQNIVNTQAVLLIRQQLEAIAPLLMEKDAKLSAEESDRLLHDTATVVIDLRVLGQLLVSQEGIYTDALNAK